MTQERQREIALQAIEQLNENISSTLASIANENEPIANHDIRTAKEMFELFRSERTISKIADSHVDTDEEKKVFESAYLHVLDTYERAMLQNGYSFNDTKEIAQYDNEINKTAKENVEHALDEINSLVNEDSINYSKYVNATIEVPENIKAHGDLIADAYQKQYRSFLMRGIAPMIQIEAKSAALTDINSKNTDEMNRRREIEGSHSHVMKLFEKVYYQVTEEIAKQNAENDALIAAELDAKENTNSRKEPTGLENMSQEYRNAYNAVYDRQYKLHTIQLNRKNEKPKEEVNLEKELDKFVEANPLQEALDQFNKNQKKSWKEKLERFKGKFKLHSNGHALKIKLPGANVLKKIGSWGKKPLYAIENVPEHFGSLNAVYNPYREEYYETEELERCAGIMIVYERLTELVGTSVRRGRDGKRNYRHIDGFIDENKEYLTESQMNELTNMKGQVMIGLMECAKPKLTPDDVRHYATEADFLLDRIQKEVETAKKKASMLPEPQELTEAKAMIEYFGSQTLPQKYQKDFNNFCVMVGKVELEWENGNYDKVKENYLPGIAKYNKQWKQVAMIIEQTPKYMAGVQEAKDLLSEASQSGLDIAEMKDLESNIQAFEDAWGQEDYKKAATIIAREIAPKSKALKETIENVKKEEKQPEKKEEVQEAVEQQEQQENVVVEQEQKPEEENNKLSRIEELEQENKMLKEQMKEMKTKDQQLKLMGDLIKEKDEMIALKQKRLTTAKSRYRRDEQELAKLRKQLSAAQSKLTRIEQNVKKATFDELESLVAKYEAQLRKYEKLIGYLTTGTIDIANFKNDEDLKKIIQLTKK